MGNRVQKEVLSDQGEEVKDEDSTWSLSPGFLLHSTHLDDGWRFSHALLQEEGILPRKFS
jgi:hypothetical protein